MGVIHVIIDALGVAALFTIIFCPWFIGLLTLSDWLKDLKNERRTDG